MEIRITSGGGHAGCHVHGVVHAADGADCRSERKDKFAPCRLITRRRHTRNGPIEPVRTVAIGMGAWNQGFIRSAGSRLESALRERAVSPWLAGYSWHGRFAADLERIRPGTRGLAA